MFSYPDWVIGFPVNEVIEDMAWVEYDPVKPTSLPKKESLGKVIIIHTPAEVRMVVPLQAVVPTTLHYIPATLSS